MILVASRGIARIERLSSWLGHEVRTRRGFGTASVDAVAGWGRKPSAARAQRWAQQLGCPCWSLEDGFLRSLEPGRGPLLSMVVDDVGIYHDATGPSRLEALVAAGCSAAQALRAQAVRAAWCEGGVSKYNHMRDPAQPLPASYVLVADQTRGDAAIERGLADAQSFERMLDAALREHPHETILVKLHPEVVSGRKKGHFDAARLAREARIRVVADDAHPVPLIAAAKAVYVVSSQLGFEALLHGRPVHTFGMPFYAGWGLTADALPAPARRGNATLDDLVHAALVAYPRYLDPESGEHCEVERAIEWMAWQRRQMQRFPAELWAVGFSGWKRPVVQDFFRGSRVRFTPRAVAVPQGAAAVVWGLRDVPQAARVIRLEDGFLRSVGLGTDLVRPLSWVQDEEGLYHDARRPSHLERLLADTAFDPALLQRAARLRERIVSAGLSKYNVGGGWRRPTAKARVILVAGQVESDASLAHGSGLRRNIDLLQAVRRANPYAHLVYKPHPDVVAELRRAGDGEDQARRWCDEVVTDAAMPTLLSLVDEVHVMTSLAGFESLLRGLPVVTYGQPFYAGWGLTQDREAPPRARRTLSLDALVAGCLILYPTYVSRDTRCFTTPERAIDELLAWRSGAPPKPDLATLLKRVLLRRVVGVR
jgi:capsular polysaccharide export protein